MDVNGGSEAVCPPAVEQGYSAGRLLGEGGRARVWLAVREDDGALFALKIPTVEQTGRRSTFETRREVNILSRFGHENLLQLHTMLDTDQGPGLLMEYAPGQSLSRLAEVRGALRPGEAVTVLAGISSALGYLHEQGVTHGEVSPGNILFSARGKPLLADLGMGRLTGQAGGKVPRTAEFQDPAGPVPDGPGLHPAADVYSLAAVGWFALTGHLPPAAEHRTPSTALAAGIPPALAAALEAGLQVEPARRPDAAAFRAFVLAGAAFEPLDLALPASGDPAGAATLRLRNRQDRLLRGGKQGRRSRRLPDGLGLDPLAPVRHRWLHLSLLRCGPVQARCARAAGSRAGGSKERGHHSRLALVAATLLVAAALGLGAVAVAAPELLIRSRAAGQETAPAVTGPQTTQTQAPRERAPESENPLAGLSGATGQHLEQLRRSEDPVQAVPALAELRTRAFLAGDAVKLGSVNVPGSPAMAADAAELAKLADAGTVLSGLTVEVLSAGPAGITDSGAGGVSIPVSVSTSAYNERRAHGGIVRTVAALPRQDLVLILVPGQAGWRIEDILTPP